jgi:hypothetical protein
MRVELLHHPGCRSAPAVHRLVQDCLAVLALPVSVRVRVGAYPSPTVLIDGADVMNPTRDVPPGHACRLDLPTRERLLAVMTAHLAGPPHEPPAPPLD